MNRRRTLALVLVLGVGGLSLAARQLLSSQVDAAGLKGMARALITTAGTEAGVDPEIRRKVTGLVEKVIDSAVPAFSGLYQNLAEVDRDQAAGASEKVLDRHLADIAKDLTGLVDLKDRLLTDASRSLTPRERATMIVKVAGTIRERVSATPDAIDGLVDSARAARQSGLKSFLKLSDERASAIFSKMNGFAAQRNALRSERRALVARLESAVAGSADDASLAALLAEWDKVAARASDVTRAQLAAARKLFTVAEQVQIAMRAKKRLERVMRIVSLIGKFRPIIGS
jgi:hypothetical protein